MKTHNRVIIFVLLFLIFVGLPYISGCAQPLPKSLSPHSLADWLAKIIQYWIDLIKHLLMQIKI
ncbi:MAG: hypothetical protein QXR45_12215 [Candidatus Bathyarchaeia archaeon]